MGFHNVRHFLNLARRSHKAAIATKKTALGWQAKNIKQGHRAAKGTILQFEPALELASCCVVLTLILGAACVVVERQIEFAYC